jgi:hypothetical protein
MLPTELCQAGEVTCFRLPLRAEVPASLAN